MSQDIRNYPEIGNVTFNKNNHAKNIRLVIKPREGVIVTVPRGITLKAAENFLLSKKNWVIKNKKKMEVKENSMTSFNENEIYKTHRHQLKFRRNQVNEYKLKNNNSIIYFYYPAVKKIDMPEVQEKIRETITLILREEAKDYLPVRVKYYCKLLGLDINNVRVKNAKTRWGSCSGKNNINLNIHLMRLPEHLRDYVILHELTHVIHKNHGEKFWEHLDYLTGGNAKKYAKEIKQYNINIY